MAGPNQFAVRGNRAAAQSGYARSPNIWYDCPWESIVNGEVAGHAQWINGVGPHGLITSPTTEAALIGMNLSGFGSSGSTITFSNAVGGGIVLTEATDNEAVGIRSSSCPFQITANGGKLWFEMRIKWASITDNAMGWIAGLWDDTTMTVNIPLSAANPPIMATTGNFVGFRAPEEDAGSVNFVYDADDAGQTTDAEVIIESAVHQGVADAFVNLGFVFDPDDANRHNTSSPGAPTLTSYVNNIRMKNTKTVPDATGTDFPADVRLGLMAFQKLGTGSSLTTTIQWMRCCQLGV